MRAGQNFASGDPTWGVLKYAGPVVAALAPFLLFPFTKTFFLAFDLVFRPATPDELL